jgi:FkbH-like protein
MTVVQGAQRHYAGLQAAREALRREDPERALGLLRELAAPTDSGAAQMQYARLSKSISKKLGGVPPLRVAFLGNVTLGHWVECLRFWLLLEDFRLEDLIVPFGTWPQQVLDSGSELYRFRPDVVWFFLSSADLHLDIELGADSRAADRIVASAIANVAKHVAKVTAEQPALCIVNNLVPPSSRVLGNLAGSRPESEWTLTASFNVSLAGGLPSGAAVFDIAHLAACYGLDRWEDARLWHHSKHPFALDAQGVIAFAAARLLAAARGRARKCLVVDLDNTLWGGVIGDDGIDGIRIGPDGGADGQAYARFQRWIKALGERGVALAICSKNNPTLAREPFERKAGMILKIEDFVAIKINWDNKADNIRAIARELNIGLDSIVFVDDNPAERALIRAELPMVGVPELPGDPSDFVTTIASGMWFEMLTLTDEDRARVRSYRDNTARAEARSVATDLESYLNGLEMEAKWGAVNFKTLARAAQLVNKTNQFHLTNKRYSEAQMQSLLESGQSWIGHFSLTDRFGDHGIIAVVVLRFDGTVALIDTWVMSCRVFARGMEDFTFGIIWKIAKQRGCARLCGTYVRSARNEVVASLYPRLGGTRLANSANDETTWSFDLTGASPIDSRHIADVSGRDPEPNF